MPARKDGRAFGDWLADRKKLALMAGGQSRRLPAYAAEGKILMPGLISHATDLVEHPDLIKERLLNYASVVGKEYVQPGTDCGIGSRVGHEEVVWAKLAAMGEGARRASIELWG